MFGQKSPKTFIIPLFEQKQLTDNFDNTEIGEVLGSFSAYVKPTKTSAKGVMAMFYAENGDDSDIISALTVTKYVHLPVKVTVFFIKNANGEIIKENGKYKSISFLARIHRPDTSDMGMTAKFMAENGKNSDEANKLNLSEYKNGMAHVVLQLADENTLLEEIETIFDDSKLDEESKKLTAKEKEELRIAQKISLEGDRVLSYSGFFENQNVIKKIFTVEEFKAFLKTRQCAFPDADGEKTCEEKGEPMEYLSGSYNAYNYVPISASHKRDFEAQSFPIDDIQSYFDNENKLLLRAFAKLRLKEILNVPNDMYIPPNLLTNWAIRNDVVHFVPMQYRQLI